MTFAFSDFDHLCMNEALSQAQRAKQNQEVPVGAVLSFENKMIAAGYNQPIGLKDPTAHAEIITMRHAAKALNNYRLLNTTLYVTLEPCVMCLAALIHARVKRLVFAALDPKAGAVCSQIELLKLQFFNHQIEWQSGLLAQPCAQILQSFFQEKRQLRP